MARINHVKKAQVRYKTVPVLNEDGTPKITPVMRKDGTPKKTKKGKEIVMRVTMDDKAQPLPNLRCGACGKDIEPGTPYKWVKIKSGPYGGAKMNRHEACPTWKPSELTSSKMSGIYAAQEQCDEQVGDCESIEDLESLRDELEEAVRGVAEEYEESATNIEEGFGHETSMSEELKQKAEDLNGWADDISNVAFDPFEETAPDDLPEDADEDTVAEAQDAWDEWIDQQRSLLHDEMANCPV